MTEKKGNSNSGHDSHEIGSKETRLTENIQGSGPKPMNVRLPERPVQNPPAGDSDNKRKGN